MDELRTLRDVWPSADERPQARLAAHDRLMRAAATDGGARHRPVRNITIGVVAVAAVAAGVVVAVSAGGAPTTARAPSAPNAKGPVAAVNGTQRILLTAAESAARTPAATGSYWVITRAGGGAQFLVDGAGGRYAIGDHSQIRLWYYLHGDQTTVYEQEQRSYFGPEGPAAVSAWKKAGSPTHWTADGQSLGAKPHGWNPVQKTSLGRPFSFAYGTLGELAALPIDPAKLRSYVLTHPRGHITRRETQESEAGWVFDAAVNILSDEPVSPQVRSAAYKMLAGIPGLRDIGQVTDPLGHRGVAIVSPDRTVGDDQQEMLVVDPATGRMLDDEWVSTKVQTLDGGHIPVGTPTKWLAPIESTWTDQPPGVAK